MGVPGRAASHVSAPMRLRPESRRDSARSGGGDGSKPRFFAVRHVRHHASLHPVARLPLHKPIGCYGSLAGTVRLPPIADAQVAQAADQETGAQGSASAQALASDTELKGRGWKWLGAGAPYQHVVASAAVEPVRATFAVQGVHAAEAV